MPAQTNTDILLFDTVKQINLVLQYFEQSFIGRCVLMICANRLQKKSEIKSWVSSCSTEPKLVSKCISAKRYIKTGSVPQRIWPLDTSEHGIINLHLLGVQRVNMCLLTRVDIPFVHRRLWITDNNQQFYTAHFAFFTIMHSASPLQSKNLPQGAECKGSKMRKATIKTSPHNLNSVLFAYSILPSLSHVKAFSGLYVKQPLTSQHHFLIQCRILSRVGNFVRSFCCDFWV